ncbi:hypothetical protein MRX96_018470 [Rhipicephalus microplus]
MQQRAGRNTRAVVHLEAKTTEGTSGSACGVQSGSRSRVPPKDRSPNPSCILQRVLMRGQYVSSASLDRSCQAAAKPTDPRTPSSIQVSRSRRRAKRTTGSASSCGVKTEKSDKVQRLKESTGSTNPSTTDEEAKGGPSWYRKMSAFAYKVVESARLPTEPEAFASLAPVVDSSGPDADKMGTVATSNATGFGSHPSDEIHMAEPGADAKSRSSSVIGYRKSELSSQEPHACHCLRHRDTRYA